MNSFDPRISSGNDADDDDDDLYNPLPLERQLSDSLLQTTDAHLTLEGLSKPWPADSDANATKEQIQRLGLCSAAHTQTDGTVAQVGKAEEPSGGVYLKRGSEVDDGGLRGLDISNFDVVNSSLEGARKAYDSHVDPNDNGNYNAAPNRLARAKDPYGAFHGSEAVAVKAQIERLGLLPGQAAKISEANLLKIKDSHVAHDNNLSVTKDAYGERGSSSAVRNSSSEPKDPHGAFDPKDSGSTQEARGRGMEPRGSFDAKDDTDTLDDTSRSREPEGDAKGSFASSGKIGTGNEPHGAFEAEDKGTVDDAQGRMKEPRGVFASAYQSAAQNSSVVGTKEPNGSFDGTTADDNAGIEKLPHVSTGHERLGKKRYRSVNDYANERDLRKALLTLEDDDDFCDQYMEWLDRIDDGEPVQKVVRQEDPNEKSFFDRMEWVLPSEYDPLTTKPQTVDGEMDRLLNLRTFDIVDFTAYDGDVQDESKDNEGGIPLQASAAEDVTDSSTLKHPRDEAMDKIAALAARIFASPVALLSIMDLGREVTIGQYGLGEATMPDVPRKITFCAHTITQECRYMVVPDCRQDQRFCNIPFVTGPPHVRFYAGASLVSPEGRRLGALCIYDDSPRPAGLTGSEIKSLCDLADTAVSMLVDRRRGLEATKTSI